MGSARLFLISWAVAVPLAWAATILLWVLGPSEEALFVVAAIGGSVPIAWTLYGGFTLLRGGLALLRGGFVLLRRAWLDDLQRIAETWTASLLASVPLSALALRDVGDLLGAGYAIGVAAGVLSAGIYLPFAAVVYCAWLAGTSRSRAVRIAATIAGTAGWVLAAVLGAALGQAG